MICLACGRRVDPMRSFCRNCGSSVFVERLSPGMQPWSVAPASVSVGSSREPTVSQSPSQTDSVRERPRPRPRLPRGERPQAPAPPAAAGSIAALVRFVILVGILWYVGSALLGVPEIRTLKDALQRGDSAQITSAAEGVRSWFQSWAPNASRETADPEPAQADESRPTTARPDLPDEAEVYTPGNGVTMPTPTERVNPDYTPEATRRKIEGTVLLTCVVRPDFTVSDVAVVRSLDAVYGLDDEAVKALKQWRFTPGRRNGRFVPVRVNVEMTFALR